MKNRITETEFDRSPDEMIAEVVARFSVLDLREMTDKNLYRGERLLGKTKKPIEVLEQGEENLIRWWKIRSDGNEYHVKRFENFVFCSCYDFFFTKNCCRHITITVKFYCKRCRKREGGFGQLCDNCAMDTVFTQKKERPKGERIGGILVY